MWIGDRFSLFTKKLNIVVERYSYCRSYNGWFGITDLESIPSMLFFCLYWQHTMYLIFKLTLREYSEALPKIRRKTTNNQLQQNNRPYRRLMFLSAVSLIFICELFVWLRNQMSKARIFIFINDMCLTNNLNAWANTGQCDCGQSSRIKTIATCKEYILLQIHYY